MTQHKSKSGIPYLRLRKDDQAPDGWARFIVKMKSHATNAQMPPQYIAAHSGDDAEKIVREDYQTHGHGYL